MACIYVHGTNKNTPQSRLIFDQKVKLVHESIRRKFVASDAMREALFQNGQQSLSPEPVVFYWGDRSQQEIEFLTQDLRLLEGARTRLAGKVRELLAYVLHDAVWFERPKNKYRILKSLHQSVLSAHRDDQPILLFGHSAGSLVVFNYLVYLLPFLDTETLLSITDSPPDVVHTVRQAALPPTCALSLIDSGAFYPDLKGRLNSTYVGSTIGVGALSPESRQLYLQRLPQAIRASTETGCLKPGMIKGMITFGSPLPLFESDVGCQDDTYSLLVSYMLKYLLENGMFWLHVNHIKDPVGFPIPGGEVITRIKMNQGIEIHQAGGLIAGNSDIRGGATLKNAHSWYWNQPDDFAGALVKTFEQGISETSSRQRPDDDDTPRNDLRSVP